MGDAFGRGFGEEVGDEECVRLCLAGEVGDFVGGEVGIAGVLVGDGALNEGEVGVATEVDGVGAEVGVAEVGEGVEVGVLDADAE